MCLVVALCIVGIAVMRNGEEMFVSAALVALLLASPHLVILRVECMQVAVDDLVGILYGLLQT